METDSILSQDRFIEIEHKIGTRTTWVGINIEHITDYRMGKYFDPSTHLWTDRDVLTIYYGSPGGSSVEMSQDSIVLYDTQARQVYGFLTLRATRFPASEESDE